MLEEAGGIVKAVDDDLRMLCDSAADFARRTRGLDRIRALRKTGIGFDTSIWTSMAELGWTGLMVPEADGGIGLGLAEACAVAHELGSTLIPEPFTSCAVLSASVIVDSDNPSLKANLLAGLCAGTLIPAVAWQEQLATFGTISTRAEISDGGVLLTGRKRFVRPGAGCNGFIVSAISDKGLGLYWLPSGAQGMTLTHEAATDGLCVANISLERAFVSTADILIGPDHGASALALAIDRALIASCAELCGLMRSALDLTLEYLRTRVQFDKPIGSFQALQHRAVDLYLQQELSSASLAEVITRFKTADTPARRAQLSSRLKARCSDAALKITREAIQMHGAIGFTDECDIGLFLKRALALSAWLGNAAEHRQRYAQHVLNGAHHD